MNEQSSSFIQLTTWYHNDLHQYVEVRKNFPKQSKATCYVIEDLFDPSLKNKEKEEKKQEVSCSYFQLVSAIQVQILLLSAEEENKVVNMQVAIDLKIKTLIQQHFGGKFTAIFKGKEVGSEETLKSINYTKQETLLLVAAALSFDEKVWIRFDKDKKTCRTIYDSEK